MLAYLIIVSLFLPLDRRTDSCLLEYRSRMAYFAELEAQGGVSAVWLRNSRRIAKEQYEKCIGKKNDVGGIEP